MTDAGRTRHPPRLIVRATEPIANALAGRRWFPLWAVVRHRGRKSGTEFATPVAIIPTIGETIVMIGLPWGARTNWALNVVAAGGATLRWNGRDEPTTAPRIISCEEGASLAKPLFRFVVKRMPAAIVLERSGAQR